MMSLKKRYVVIAGILGGFAIAFHDSAVEVWQKLQTHLVAPFGESANARAEPTSPIRTPGQVSDFSSNRLVSNSSISEHFRSSNLEAETSYAAGSVPKTSPPWPVASSSPQATRITGPNQLPTVRIASFSLEGFGESKLKKAAVVETVARMIRQFDVIALQHIQSKQQNILPELLDKVNQSDRRYDYCIGPRVGSASNQQQYAILFDTDRLET